MFKPFYVHINPHAPGKMSSRHPRGATLLVKPGDDHRSCVVQGAWCSPKDAFCKKTGRATAAQAEEKIINRRDLPKLCDTMEDVVWGGNDHRAWRAQSGYNHLLRNFL